MGSLEEVEGTTPRFCCHRIVQAANLATDKRTNESSEVKPHRDIFFPADLFEKRAALGHVAVTSGVDAILDGHLDGTEY